MFTSKKITTPLFKVCLPLLMLGLAACSKGGDSNPDPGPDPVAPAALLNATHLESLMTNVTFDNGQVGTAVYIYADAPSYTPIGAVGEGFTCVDDVARALQYYVRHADFATSQAIQDKAYGLTRFVLNMQAPNGYFYNFVQTGNAINKFGITSINTAKWWSWRALQGLTEAAPIIRTKNTSLAAEIDAVVNKLVAVIKTELVNLPETTKLVEGVEVPEWLPEGADQGATMLLGLIPYATASGDAEIRTYIKKLADGIVRTQLGGAAQFPYGVFLSSGNHWHAYGCDQAHALFAAAKFLNDASYSDKAKIEVDQFYSWIISSGFKSSFDVRITNNVPAGYNQTPYEQIAYGVRPMVFAALDAYELTKDEQYADKAGRLASWFFGNNSASAQMYSRSNGRCFDAINTGNAVNRNSGAESTIEALLALQRISTHATVIAAMDKYSK
ncbi:MAG: hypothetical protein P0Y53_00320 [Candidatus Pseudobacter hemicellulosilyticus]|uniref:Uncharacterized protein n=1 Tax=Candidatus Pseudobacter hemicellulosilyticus TaxID=3121375 RepID=A0AAJ6BG87_9BACT|nr:MAG: hypothetical protein P0Y53_00320 [Pseudobacter sp.]